MTTPRAALGITDGETFEDIEEDIHWVFGVNCDNVSQPVETVGDVFDFIALELADAPRGHACQTLVAFNRIRSALVAHAPRAGIRPSTDLSMFGQSPHKLHALIRRSTKLDLPLHKTTWAGLLGFACMLVGVVCLIGGIFGRHELLWLSPALLVGFWLSSQDAFRFPEECRTVGELARATAKRNVARLAAEGGRLHADDIWSALVEILETRTLQAEGVVVRETRLGK